MGTNHGVLAAGGESLSATFFILLVNVAVGHAGDVVADHAGQRFLPGLLPVAVGQLALDGLDRPLTDGLKLEREGYRWLVGTDDAREGALAFAEKRPPNWQGK